MGRLRQAILDLSIKKTFMLYMLIFILLALLLSSISINVAGSIRNTINLSYNDMNESFLLQDKNTELFVASTPIVYSPKDKSVILICDFVEMWSIPLFLGICIVLSALLFYRAKLKSPIAILSEASEKIAANDLDFQLAYKSRDEMGRLCASFETMRASLEINNRELWNAMEERKRLNAAFSHDLRTPLTVLRGYTDLLRKYAPQGRMDQEKILATVSTMSGQIARLESYVQMMNDVQKLEDIAVSKEKTDGCYFWEQLKNSAALLAENTALQYSFTLDIEEKEICMDASIVLRVFENLVSNAMRYAKNRICVSCRYREGTLWIAVSDDGKGFTAQDLKLADKPYYRNQPNPKDAHFGLGLTICKILCQKHGGSLMMNNGIDGGAVVTASFCAMP